MVRLVVTTALAGLVSLTFAFWSVDEGDIELAFVAVFDAGLAFFHAGVVEGLQLAVRVVAAVEVLFVEVIVPVAVAARNAVTVVRHALLRVTQEFRLILLANEAELSVVKVRRVLVDVMGGCKFVYLQAVRVALLAHEGGVA